MCILEEGDCPEACEGVVKKAEDKKQDETKDDNNEVKSGSLTVSFEESDTKKDVPSNGTVIIDTLNFKANEDVTVRSITIATDGMTKQDAIFGSALNPLGFLGNWINMSGA